MRIHADSRPLVSWVWLSAGGPGALVRRVYTSAITHLDGMERAVADFIPGISPSGLAFYTGQDFPSWRSSAFVGAQRLGMIAPTGRLVRIQFDDKLNERAREELLVDVRQRICDVRMGPDGLMYLLTDEEDALCSCSSRYVRPAPKRAMTRRRGTVRSFGDGNGPTGRALLR